MGPRPRMVGRGALRIFRKGPGRSTLGNRPGSDSGDSGWAETTTGWFGFNGHGFREIGLQRRRQEPARRSFCGQCPKLSLRKSSREISKFSSTNHGAIGSGRKYTFTIAACSTACLLAGRLASCSGWNERKVSTRHVVWLVELTTKQPYGVVSRFGNQFLRSWNVSGSLLEASHRACVPLDRINSNRFETFL